MDKEYKRNETLRFAGKEGGSSLIEMMIAIVVLTVGLVGSVVVVSVAIGSNGRSKKDSTAAALAEMVTGQISAIPVGGSTTTVTIQDCGGNNWTVGVSGTSAGSGANLNSNGNVDFTQTYSSVPANYAMKYTVCGVSNSMQSIYDVRWNVKLLPSGKEEFVVVGAQFISDDYTQNALAFVAPVNVRTVVGNDGE